MWSCVWSLCEREAKQREAIYSAKEKKHAEHPPRVTAGTNTVIHTNLFETLLKTNPAHSEDINVCIYPQHTGSRIMLQATLTAERKY